MNCYNCQTDIPDEASFCLNCGVPQKPDIQPERPKWEMCQIICTHFKMLGSRRDEWEFKPEVNGPSGTYLACEPYISSVDPHADFGNLSREKNSYIMNVHGSLVRELKSLGWEDIDIPGTHWFNLRFRRRVKI